MNRVHPRKCWRENEKGGKCSIPRLLLRPLERILIYQSEKKKRIAFEYDFLDPNAAHYSLERASNTFLSFESSNRETLFTDIAKYFPPPMDLVSGSGVTRDARKRKVEVLLSGEEFEEAD